MIALDTNVLVRLLVADDARQTRQALACIERIEATGDVAFVPTVVVCEFVWVLRSAYRFDRATIARALERLLAARQLHFEEPERMARALRAYARGRGDFADYVIRESARGAGCEAVLTFDRILHAEDLFVAP